MNTYGELGIGTTADTGTPTTVVAINVTWTSSDPSVATITAGGLATGSRSGSVTITATLDSRSGSTTLTVAAPQFVLTVNKAGIGSGTVTSSPQGINCGSACSSPYDSGSVVTLTATPAMLSVFNGWSGCDTVSGASCTVSMSAAKSVTANFFGVPLQ